MAGTGAKGVKRVVSPRSKRLGVPVFLGLLAAGLIAVPAPEAAPTLVAGVTADTVGPLLQADLAGQASSYGIPAADWAAVRRFYQLRNFQPAWALGADADLAVAALQGAGADGLNPEAFHTSALAGIQTLATPSAAAAYDIRVSAALIRYATNLRRGAVDPGDADKMVGIVRSGFDPASTLAAALAASGLKAWLDSLPPDHPEYAELKAALARYRTLAATGGWPSVPAIKKIQLKPGSPGLAELQRRLAATDTQYAAAAPDDLDALGAAIQRFQAENGLPVDGVAGRETIAALNITASDRVAQIAANMERWRWMPHSFPARYVAVNAADTTLKAVDNGKVVLTSRVITGKPSTPTAIFNADAIALTANPWWNVPSAIARNEILPKLRRNPAYLSSHHMIMVDGQVRQLPGDDNALGYLKVEMPNRFTAYLHDTSTRKLFARDERHLSHGCIRVQNIRPLGSWLLTGDVEQGIDRIDAAIDTHETQKIALDRPVAIFVLYWTAIPRDDGGIDFRPDVYGRDKRLIAALAGQSTAGAASLGTGTESECGSPAG
jgi:murein L,D-transpeptidase YcbB/YkuD